MKRSGRNIGWILLVALGLVLVYPAYAADVGSKDMQESEIQPHQLKRPLPTATRPGTEPVTSTAPVPVTPKTAATKAVPHAPAAIKPAKLPHTPPAPAAKALTVLSPNGGESFAPGDRVQVQWQAGGIPGPGAIQLLQNGRKVADIAASVNLSEGKRSWRVPKDIQSGNYTVRIQSRDKKYSDTSDQPFTIGIAAAMGGAKGEATSDTGTDTTTDLGTNQATPATESTPAVPSLSFISPTNDARWCTNQPHEYRWNSTLPPGSNVRIDWMQGDMVWRTIVASTPDTGSYAWPGYTDAQFGSGMGSFRPRISAIDNSVVHVGGYLHFGKPLWINAPQSNHTWRAGSPYTLRWTQLCDLPAPAVLELLNSSQQPVLTIAEGLTATGHHMPRSHAWTVPNDLPPGTYYFRVRSADNQLASSGSFIIANPVSFPVSPDLTFTSPVKDTGWCTNLPHEFRWNTTLPADTRVKLDLMDGNGEYVWRSIAADIPNSGNYAWVGYTDAQFGFGQGTFRPRIATLDNSVITVGEQFHIGKHLMLEAPKSNHVWRKGSSYDIRWTQLCDLPAAVTLELLDASRQSIATIAGDLTTAGSSQSRLFKWTVPNDLTPGTYYIRVRTADQQYLQESSFTIAEP